MRIINLRAERFKRISVVEIAPDGGVVQITGKNGNGKSSVLDAIEAALGGAHHVPGVAISKGHSKGKITVTLGDKDGTKFIVERRFTEKAPEGYLEVRAADGATYKKSPQEMLTRLLGVIGFDPTGFLRLKPAEQAAMLRSVVTLEEDIEALDVERASLYSERTLNNRQLTSAQARVAAIKVPDDLPDEEPDISDLTEKMETAMLLNRELDNAERQHDEALRLAHDAGLALEALRVKMAEATSRYEAIQKAADEFVKPDIERVDIDAIKAEIADAESIKAHFRTRDSLFQAQGEADTFKSQAEELTAAIDKIDERKSKALANAKMPIDGLSFADGVVTYNSLPFDQASGSEQLRISAAIGAALNPQLRVLLARDGSLLDSDSLKALAEFATEKDMQIFLERVEESGEVGIVMEDGHVKGQEAMVAEFEKGETTPEPETPTATTAAETDDETKDPNYPKAQAHVESKIKELADVQAEVDLNILNAKVKNSIKRFPGLSRTWAAAYLERLQALKSLRQPKARAQS